MEQSTVLRHFVWITGILAVAIILAGCTDRGPQSAGETTPEIVSRQPQAEPEPAAEGELPPRESQIEPEAERGSGPKPETVAQSESEPMPDPTMADRVAKQAAVTAELAAKLELPEVVEADLGKRKIEPAAESPTEKPELEPMPPDGRKPIDLGPPLVKDPTKLKRLDKARPVWIDTANKRVVIMGQVCQREAMLELFACLRNTKEHEAVVSVDAQAVSVHAGLLAVGAKNGKPATWDPEYSPATGTEIEVTVVWIDAEGKRKTARAQDWVLNTQTKKAMTHPWVFAGSRFWEDGETGKKYYQAEGGDLICVSNFPSAMLDLPIQSSQANEELLFRAFAERIPPLGTPVTLLLTPKLEDQKKPKTEETEEGADKKVE